MHNLLAVALLVAATSYKPSVSLTAPVNPSLVQRHDAIASNLTPSAKMKLDTIVDQLKSTPSISDGTSRAAITSAFPDANLGQDDIDALVLTVMTGVAQSAHNELKETLQHLQDINKQKDALRQELAKSKQSTKAPAVHKAQAMYVSTAFKMPAPLPPNASVAQKQDRLNLLNDLDQQEQTRVQMYSNQMQKSQQIASDLLKRVNDTASSIIRNLK